MYGATERLPTPETAPLLPRSRYAFRMTGEQCGPGGIEPEAVGVLSVGEAMNHWRGVVTMSTFIRPLVAPYCFNRPSRNARALDGPADRWLAAAVLIDAAAYIPNASALVDRLTHRQSSLEPGLQSPEIQITYVERTTASWHDPDMRDGLTAVDAIGGWPKYQSKRAT